MARQQSKRVQLVALGWAFVPIPRFWAAGALWHDKATGQESPERWDDKNPVGWTAKPPPGFPAGPRRFDASSPNPAVRWAWDQATAPRLKPELGGVAGLVALMGDARRSGIVADRADADCALPVRPDAELLALCGEIMGAGRVVDEFRSGSGPCPWTEKPAHQRAMSGFSEACRTQDRLVPRVVEVSATTTAGVIAKAKVIERLFDNKRGGRADAVRSLLADLAAVLQPGANAGGLVS